MDTVDKIVIGENHIKYYDEILKITNISRTWIFRFQNIEKKKFEEEKLAYKNDKERYEETEARKKKNYIRNILIGAFISLIVSIFGFLFKSFGIAILFLFLAGGWVYMALGINQKKATFPYPPPVERMCPDKFGLSIEMNSGHSVTFTAIDDGGLRALRELQSKIENADMHKDKIIFNLNDYNISVENNEGVINTGDYANNIYQKEGNI